MDYLLYFMAPCASHRLLSGRGWKCTSFNQAAKPQMCYSLAGRDCACGGCGDNIWVSICSYCKGRAQLDLTVLTFLLALWS